MFIVYRFYDDVSHFFAFHNERDATKKHCELICNAMQQLRDFDECNYLHLQRELNAIHFENIHDDECNLCLDDSMNVLLSLKHENARVTHRLSEIDATNEIVNYLLQKNTYK